MTPHSEKHLLTMAAASTLLLLSVLGCADSTTHIEDNEKQAHVIPAHKPKSLQAALLAIETRQAKWNLQNTQEVQELREIIDWLPELAAQTDLKKADWDRIHEISQLMGHEYDLARKNQQQWILPDSWQEMQELSKKESANFSLHAVLQENPHD